MKNYHILSNKMKKNHKNIGKRIREIRKEMKMSQIEFSKILKITQDKLSKYENGRIRPPIEIILSISKIFNISLNWLLMGKGDKYLKKEEEFDEEIYKMAKNLQVLKEKDADYFDKIKNTILPWLKK